MKTLCTFLLAVLASIVFACSKPEPIPVLKPSVSVQTATDITPVSATLKAAVTPNSEGTSVMFEYKPVAASNWQIATLYSSYSGKTIVNVSVNITGLSSSVEYTYRVRAVNASGAATSTTSNFTTLAPPAVKPVVVIKVATGIEITKATLVAKVVPNENGTTVSFEYKTQVASTWTAVSVSGTLSGKDSVEVTTALNNLVANTDYVYRVKATNVAGETISSESKFQTYAVRDYDGNYYHTVTIGAQTWTKENLKTTHFANGDPIPNVTDATAWTKLTTGAYCYYNNDPEIGKTYGALYNWFVANDPRGLLVGYHVATDTEWTTMKAYLGNVMQETLDTSGGKLKEAGTVHWKEPNFGATNSSGFTALPGGARQSLAGAFDGLTLDAAFWSSTSAGLDAAWAKALFYNRQYLANDGAAYKENGASLRLIKN